MLNPLHSDYPSLELTGPNRAHQFFLHYGTLCQALCGEFINSLFWSILDFMEVFYTYIFFLINSGLKN